VKTTTIEAVGYQGILEEFGMTCHICGGSIATTSDLEFDHVVPLACGGQHVRQNIKPSHRLCNLRKGAKLIGE
jgi:5-methylcytosine-specific restriction endonuclease McrA